MTENDDIDELLDMDGLAARLKLPKASVYKLVAAGRIPGQKVGKHWRFLPSEIDAWLRAGMRSPRRPAPAAAAPVRAPVAFAGGGAPAHFEAAVAPAAISAGAGGASGGAMQGVFTAAQLVALRERWIETPKQFLAQVERTEGRRRLAELLQLSEDRLQQKIIEVAMLAAAPAERDTAGTDQGRH